MTWQEAIRAHFIPKRERMLLVIDPVIIQIGASPPRATFITAYVADPATLQKIRGMPRW